MECRETLLRPTAPRPFDAMSRDFSGRVVRPHTLAQGPSALARKIQSARNRVDARQAAWAASSSVRQGAVAPFLRAGRSLTPRRDRAKHAQSERADRVCYRCLLVHFAVHGMQADWLDGAPG